MDETNILGEEELATLTTQLGRLKEEQQDIRIEVKEIDFNLNELLDLQVKKRKRQLRAIRNDLLAKAYNNAISISELERAIYSKSYKTQNKEE